MKTTQPQTETGNKSREEEAREELQKIRASLRRLEWRDWWQWWAAIFVMLLLTGVIAVLSLPSSFREGDWLFQDEQFLAVRGLVGLVLLFSTYTVYQRVLIKRLRKQLSEQGEALGALQVVTEELRKLAVLDPLTGLYNRRLADQRLSEEIARAERYGHLLTVLILDLDDFKNVNDELGHHAGDAVLQHFASQLDNAIRASDLATRFGGDEFLLLLPEYDGSEVESLIARLQRLDVTYQDQTIPINFSAGWATHRKGETSMQLVERADQNLYSYKRASSDEPSPGEPSPDAGDS